MVYCLKFLNQDSFQTYNREVARHCESVNASIMLSELINRFEYHLSKGELVSHEKYGEGWFYLTIEKAEERTCLTRREQDSGLGILKKKGFIEIVQFGLPCKRYFKINENNVLEVFGLSKIDYSLAKNAKPVCRGKPVCTKTPNCNGEKRQTAPIYKEPQEEPHKTTSLENSRRRSLTEKEKETIPIFEKALMQWNWRIDPQVIEFLLIKYGALYLRDQINKMIDKEDKAQKYSQNSFKSSKVKPIEEPETYLKLSCEKNWASSINIQDSENK